LSKDSALEIVQKRYQENKKIYKELYGFEFGEDLSVFDKIIETDGLNASEVLDIAKTVVRKLF
jgi:cytidylate kinase